MSCCEMGSVTYHGLYPRLSGYRTQDGWSCCKNCGKNALYCIPIKGWIRDTLRISIPAPKPEVPGGLTLNVHICIRFPPGSNRNAQLHDDRLAANPRRQPCINQPSFFYQRGLLKTIEAAQFAVSPASRADGPHNLISHHFINILVCVHILEGTDCCCIARACMHTHAHTHARTRTRTHAHAHTHTHTHTIITTRILVSNKTKLNNQCESILL